MKTDRRKGSFSWGMIVILFFVIIFSISKLVVVIPGLSGLAAEPWYPYWHDIQDLVALIFIFIAAYRYSIQLGLVATAVFFVTHVPFIIVEFTEKQPEIARLLFGTAFALFGIWAINRLRTSEEKYHSLFTGMQEGLAHCKMLFTKGKPVDFVYLDVNSQFEKLTGLHDVVGKKVTEIIPGIRQTNPELFDIYGRVASGGEPETFETYVPELGLWFSVSVYNPRKEHFVAVFDVINARKQAEEKIKTANADLEIAQRLAKTGNWKWNIISGEITWSKGLRLLNGWDMQKSPPAFSEMSSFYTPEGWKRLNDAVANTLATGEPYDLDLDLIRTDGRVIKTQTRGEATLNSESTIVDLHGTVQDVTQIKQAEERIKHLASTLKTIRNINQLITREKNRESLIQKSCELLIERPDLNAVWIVLFEKEGNIVAGRSKSPNKDTAKFFEGLKTGHYAECLMQVMSPGKKFVSFATPGNLHRDCVMAEKHTKQDTFRCKLEYQGRTYGLIGFSGAPGTGLDIEEQDLFIELCDDISFALDSIRQEDDRKKAEAAHRASEDNFRHSVDDSPLGVRVLNKHGETVYANQTFLQMYGFNSLPEFAATPSNKLYTPEAYLEHKKRVEKRKNGDYVPPRYEISIVRTDGKIRHLEVFRRDIIWDGVRQSQSLYRDVTDVKNLQEQLVMQDRLVSIGQLVSGVAHELNNPLTSVIGFSELLLQRQLPEDIAADLQIINTEAKRTSTIVKNLLTFARQQPQEKHPLHISEPLKAVLQLRSHEHTVNNIRVNTSFAPDLPLVMANGSQLQQVFFNIVTNAEFAISESHHKGTITVLTEKAGDCVRVSIADTGPGINPANMKRLFSPFFTTKALGQGTGLGLSICQGIIAEHGGRIWAESEPGKGATFKLELPAYVTSKSESVNNRV